MNEQHGVGSSNPMSLAVALSFADSPRRQASLQAPADTIDELYEALRVLAAAVRPAPETSDIQHLMAALVDQEGVLNECETLLREALDDRGVNVGFDDRLIAYWAKTKALSDWRTRDLRLTQKANDPLAQLEDDATFGEIVEEIQTGKMAVKEREGKL